MTRKILSLSLALILCFALVPVSALAVGYTMSLDKSGNYVPGESITVTVSGFTQADPAKYPVVHVCNPGDPIGQYIDYWNIRGSGETRSRTFNMDLKEGKYEMRFITDHDNPSATYVTKLEFTVGNQATTTTPPTQPTQPSQPSQPEQPAQPSAQTPSLTATAISSGVKLEWTPLSGVLGYRVYRSTMADTEGISVTDFPISGSPFVDVNVDANTTYYYSLRAVLQEANITGQREQLSSPSAQISIKTNASILGGNISDSGGKTKNVILMKLNDPSMSVNGAKQGIDPGRDTAPQVLNGRTIVPIRAIIEAMGGKLGWEDASGKITLEANGHSVTMWLNQKDLIVDGKNQEMDVAPVSINGRTMVPVRFAAENLGCVVDWIASTGEIVIVYYTGGTPTLSIPPIQQTVPDPTASSTEIPDGKTDTPVKDTSGENSQPTSPIQPTGESLGATEGPELKISYTAEELAKIRGEVEALIQDAPSGGREITWQELQNILAPYEKDRGNGNTDYNKNMVGQFQKEDDKWRAFNILQIGDNWSKETDSKSETLYVLYPLPEKEGAVECRLNKEDAQYYYSYEWYKTATTGIMTKTPKTSQPSIGVPGNISYDPSQMPDLKVTLYPEATVAGQECIVYGFAMQGMDIYFWFSKTKGFVILTETMNPMMPFTSAVFTYESKRIDTAASFFDPNNQGVTVWNER